MTFICKKYLQGGHQIWWRRIRTNRVLCVRRNDSECLDFVAQNDYVMLSWETNRGHPFMGSKTKPANRMLVGENAWRPASFQRGFQSRKRLFFSPFIFELWWQSHRRHSAEKSTLTAASYIKIVPSKAVQSDREKRSTVGTRKPLLLHDNASS